MEMLRFIVDLKKADGTSNRNDGAKARYNLEGYSVDGVIKQLQRQGYTENAATIEVYEINEGAQVIGNTAPARLVRVVKL